MAAIKKKLFILLLALIALFAPSQALDQSDAWEARLNRLQPPEKVLAATEVKPGMVIGEVGAGRGRYTVHLSGWVGPQGRVYAEDIDAGALDYLRFRCRRDQLTNIETIMGTVSDPLLPENALGMVFMVNTYHHLKEKAAILQNIVPALKNGGRLVILEPDPLKTSGERNRLVSRPLLVRQVEAAGFELAKLETFLAHDNIYVFILKSPRPERE